MENPGRMLRSTIRDISNSPPTGAFAFSCIQVGMVTETVDGTPPPSGTPGTPVNTPVPGATTPVPPVPGDGRTIFLPITVNK
jgi:hypothetical protein